MNSSVKIHYTLNLAEMRYQVKVDTLIFNGTYLECQLTYISSDL